MTHRTAHDVVAGFDGALQGLAMGLGAALVRDSAARSADRNAARAIRARTAALAYNRVMSEETAALRARSVRQEQDRRLRVQRIMALAAAQRE